MSEEAMDILRSRAEAAEAKLKELEGQEPFDMYYKHSEGCLFSHTRSSTCDTEGCSPVPMPIYAKPILPVDAQFWIDRSLALETERAELERKYHRVEEIADDAVDLNQRQAIRIAELERKLACYQAVSVIIHAELRAAGEEVDELVNYEELNTLLDQAREEGRKGAGTLFNVFHSEQWVGTFYQGSFSSKEKAEQYAANNKYGDPLEEMVVEECVVDSLLAAAPTPGDKE